MERFEGDSVAEDNAYQAALDCFNYWFSQSGHWIYPNRADAYQTWQERGIDGLPQYPA